MPLTEAERNTSKDPQAMLAFLRTTGKLSERKARLFAVACCRRIWSLLSLASSRLAVEMAEQYAEDRMALEELEPTAEDALCDADDLGYARVPRAVRCAAYSAAFSADDAAFTAAVDAAAEATNASEGEVGWTNSMVCEKRTRESRFAALGQCRLESSSAALNVESISRTT